MPPASLVGRAANLIAAAPVYIIAKYRTYDLVIPSPGGRVVNSGRVSAFSPERLLEMTRSAREMRRRQTGLV